MLLGKEKRKVREPKRFVSLHNHTDASTYDGFGSVETHINFCIDNELSGHAITEHGHMNSYASGVLYNEKLRSKGKKFKLLTGVEAYIHPNLSEWRKLRETEEQKKIDKKNSQKREENEQSLEIDMKNSLTIENEDASKQQKFKNPLNRRHHLVILPKSDSGLKKIFSLVSFGYIDGFYRFPRIDIPELKRIVNGENDIIISTACLGGIFSYEILNSFNEISWDDLRPELLLDSNFEDKILKILSNTHDMYADAVGVDNMFLELQFNKLQQQDLVNHAIIRYAKKHSLTKQLIVTCDAHYPGPDSWKDREIYKKLGYMNYTEINPDLIPKNRDELKCELYPKNVNQIWNEYKTSKARCELYNDECDDLICDAIERSYDIAHDLLQDIEPDRSPKYPKCVIPSGKSAFQALVEQSKEGLIKHGLHENQEYIDRLKEELLVIKELKASEYFITLAKMMSLIKEQVLTGTCRGSGGGSLVNYCLGITDVDPVKYGLYFARFLNKYRVDPPDVDIDIEDRDLSLDILRKEFGNTNVIPISNYNLMKLKSLTKDLAKFYGIPFEVVNAATATVDEDVKKVLLGDFGDKNMFQLTYDDAMKYSPSYKKFIDEHPEVGNSIKSLFSAPRSVGRHAGGCVVSEDVRNRMPLITVSGEPQTPWVEGVSVKTLEKIAGWIKYDLLGLLTLRLIRRSIELILQNKIRIYVHDKVILCSKDEYVILSNGTQILASQLTIDDDIDNAWINSKTDFSN